MLQLQNLSDLCLHGVYVWQKFWRKNILNWVIIWIKFKVLWLLELLYSALVSSGPQLQRQLTCKSWLGATGPECHLQPKIGHLQKTEVAFKSQIWPWHKNSQHTILLTLETTNSWFWLVNNNQNISYKTVIPTELGDHDIITCVRKVNNVKYESETISYRDYKNYDVNVINTEFFNINWDGVYNSNSPNHSLNVMKSVLKDTIDMLHL